MEDQEKKVEGPAPVQEANREALPEAWRRFLTAIRKQVSPQEEVEK